MQTFGLQPYIYTSPLPTPPTPPLNLKFLARLNIKMNSNGKSHTPSRRRQPTRPRSYFGPFYTHIHPVIGPDLVFSARNHTRLATTGPKEIVEILIYRHYDRSSFAKGKPKGTYINYAVAAIKKANQPAVVGILDPGCPATTKTKSNVYLLFLAYRAGRPKGILGYPPPIRPKVRLQDYTGILSYPTPARLLESIFQDMYAEMFRYRYRYRTRPRPRERILQDNTGLLKLPNELIEQVAEFLGVSKDLFNLTRTGARLASLLTPKLHRMEVASDKGSYLLNRAIRCGDAEKIEILVKVYGADVNAGYKTPRHIFLGPQAPLYFAAHAGSLKCFQKLVELGANTIALPEGSCDCSKERSSLLLHCAINGRDLGIIRLAWTLPLVSRIDIMRGITSINFGLLFHTAVKATNLSYLRKLIAMGLNVNTVEPGTGNTPLHYAKHVEIVRLLLENGADKYALNSGLKTPVNVVNKRIEFYSTIRKHVPNSSLHKQVCDKFDSEVEELLCARELLQTHPIYQAKEQSNATG